MFILLLTVAAEGAPTKSIEKIERIRDRGYFTKTSRGKVFFVRNPIVIDPGVEVVDPATIKKGTLCILEKTTEPHECPVQEISFHLKPQARGAVMTDLRLESETAWHRLNRVQKKFAP